MKRFLLAFFISLVLVYLLLRSIRIEEISDLLLRSKVRFLFLALFFYALQYLGRALRFVLLIRSEKLPVGLVFGIVCLHNLFNYLLPVRAGEISFPVLAKRYADVSATEGVGVLLVARILDLAAILALFIVSLLLLSGRLLKLDRSVTVLFSLFLLLLLFLLLRKLGFVLRGMARWMRAAGGRIVGERFQDGWELALRKIDAFVEVLDPILEDNILWIGLGVSLIIWMSFALSCYSMIHGFGVHASFLQVVFGSTCTAVTGVLPVSGLGNFGTMEAGWSIALYLTGMPKEEAISSAFAIHLLVLAFVGILSVAGGFLLLARKGR